MKEDKTINLKDKNINVESIRETVKEESAPNQTTKSEENIKIFQKCRYWNSGYCRSKSLCVYLHPKDHCKNDKCNNKECEHRHIKPCKNWLKNSCQFDKTCEFRHDIIIDEKNTNLDNFREDELSDDFHDFDNFDAEGFEEIFVEEKTTLHSPLEFSCDKCDFKAQSKAKLIMHENSKHKIIKLNKDYIDYDNVDSDDDDDIKSGTFSCDECDFTSHVKSHLTKHVKTSHKSEPKLLKRKRISEDLPNRKKTKEEKFHCDEFQFKTNTVIVKKHSNNIRKHLVREM